MTAAKTPRKPRTRKTQAIVPVRPWMDDQAALTLKMRAREVPTDEPVLFRTGELYHRADGGSAIFCHGLELERRQREDDAYYRVMDGMPRPGDPEPWAWYHANQRPVLSLVASEAVTDDPASPFLAADPDLDARVEALMALLPAPADDEHGTDDDNALD